MPDWERLAEHTLNRRVELGYIKRPAFADASGISLRTLSSIETAARSNYDRNTLAAIETALHWAPGSVRAVLDGGNPTPADPGRTTATTPALTAQATLAAHTTDDPLLRVLNADIPSAVKEQIVKQLLAEQRQFAQQRAAELLNEAFDRQ